MNKITFKLVQGGNSGAHGLPVQLNIPAAGRFSQMLPRNAFLDCLEEGAMDYLLFSQGSGDPAEILLIQLSPGKAVDHNLEFLIFPLQGCCLLLPRTKGWKPQL